jgi:ABC-type antimicrobial peptide transport system permease subunit
VVNETLARGFFPHGAIGHKILLGAPQPGARWLTIVGVVGDVKTVALDYDTMPQFYTPEAQDASGSMAMVTRTTNDPMAMAREASAVVHSLDPEQPVYNIQTMEQRVAKSVGEPRFETLLVSFFAMTALFLAAIGIFGVVAHSTQQRTQEIGIRMALGADASSVVRHVIFDGLRPVLIGVALGLAGALALSRLLSTVLFQVKADDPSTFTLAAAVLTLVAVAACLAPARKATRIDPASALRSE